MVENDTIRIGAASFVTVLFIVGILDTVGYIDLAPYYVYMLGMVGSVGAAKILVSRNL